MWYLIKKKKFVKKDGFTLVELIVVISIILILSGVLIPKVIGYQDKARNAKAINTAKQIFDASMESYTEQEGHFKASDLSTAISSVTGLTLATGDVVIPDDDDKSATIKFTSDSKSFSVAVSADTNEFEVKDASAVSIYTSK